MSTLATNAITDAAGGNTTTINGYTPTDSNMAGRNRIINGNMLIDQRNAGASYTISGDDQYGVDRFAGRTYGGSGRFSMQQVTDAPEGFSKSLKVTVTTTDTSGTNGYGIEQRIEGVNISDFNFGSASAKTYTVSFWVKSSVTGTYTFGNRLGGATASCVNTYTINSANTWEKKTFTFPANTAFSGVIDNNTGLLCDFGFGAQTSKSTDTLGVWQAGNYVFNSGQVDLMQTSGATFYITGVQLEAGSVATPFEHRQYGTELSLCYRYYEAVGDIVGGTTQQTLFADNYSAGAGQTTAQFNWFYRQEKRATPTIAIYGTIVASNVSGSTIGPLNPTSRNCCLYGSPAGAGRVYWFNNAGSGFSANAEL